MQGYRDTDVVRAKVGVRDPSKIPEVVELTVDSYIYYIFFEVEEIVECGGALRDGILIEANSDSYQIDRQDGRGAKKCRNTAAEKGQGSGGNRDMQRQNSVEMQGADLEKEVEMRKNMLERKQAQEEAEKVAKSKGLEEINREFAADAERMDFTSDGYSQQQVNFEEDMVESTQIIQERVLKEYGGCEEEVLDSQPERVSGVVSIISDSRQVNKQILGESIKDINKNKNGVVDEERRKTQRNVGDMNTMDKAVDRAKVKDLETIPEKRRQQKLRDVAALLVDVANGFFNKSRGWAPMTRRLGVG